MVSCCFTQSSLCPPRTGICDCCTTLFANSVADICLVSIEVQNLCPGSPVNVSQQSKRANPTVLPLQQLPARSQPSVVKHLRNTYKTKAWANLLPLKAGIQTHHRSLTADQGVLLKPYPFFNKGQRSILASSRSL